MENKTKNNTVLFAIVIVLLLATISLLVYATFFRKEVKDTKETIKNNVINTVKETDTNKDTNTEEELETLTTDSFVVKTLYSYISMNDEYKRDLFEIASNSKDKVLYMKDLNQSTLNYIGYNYIKQVGSSISSCSDKDLVTFFTNYTNKNKNTKLKCGYYDEMTDEYTDYTTIVKESYLKESVEKIFGTGKYKKADFASFYGGVDNFIYKDDIKSYVHAATSAVGGEWTTTKLLGVKNTVDTITLNISVLFDFIGGEKTEKFNATYKLDNGNYYLYSIEKA